MPRFVASVLTPDGTSKHMYVEAGNLAIATAMLEEQGYRSVSIHNSAEEQELERLNSAFVQEQLQELTPSQAVRSRRDGMGLVLQRKLERSDLASALMAWGLLSSSIWIGGVGLLMLGGRERRERSRPRTLGGGQAKAVSVQVGRRVTCTRVSRCRC